MIAALLVSAVLLATVFDLFGRDDAGLIVGAVIALLIAIRVPAAAMFLLGLGGLFLGGSFVMEMIR